MKDPKSILITGASSGLGAALALAYAKKDVTLFLGGRDATRLEETARQARERDATVHTKIIDVCDEDEMARWVREAHDLRKLELVIANAGISAGTGKGDELPAQSKAIFATNVHGVFHTIWPALALMKRQGYGQLAIVSSLAGFRGLPGAPSYCASKAAIRIYGEGLRNDVAAYGVQVNVICPGFIKTPMTDVNDFPMPFVMSAQTAATIIKSGLEKDKSRISFPAPMAFLLWLGAALPVCLTDRLLAKLPRKP